MNKQYIVILLLIILGFPSRSVLVYAQNNAPVVVQACRQNLPDGKAKYSYKLINNSGQEIVIMTIGWDGSVDPKLLEPELLVHPVGWDFDTGIPADSSTSPAGWHAMVITQEESNYHYLQWEIDDSYSSGLLPGKTLQGFSVILPQPDDRYLNSHFNVILRGGKLIEFSATPEKIDCNILYSSPPSLEDPGKQFPAGN